MTLPPDDECLVLAGRRLVPDENGDEYFRYIADELRKNGGKAVFTVCRNVVQLYGARE